MIYSSFPETTSELFKALQHEDQLSGFIYGVDFSSELEAQLQLYELIIGLEDASEGNNLFRYPGFEYILELKVYPPQRKFVFSRLFLN